MKAEREFQIFVKPVGARCNLHCTYCYYYGKKDLYRGKEALMSGEVLERFIIQSIEASDDEAVRFSWHGGEPMLAGIDFYREAVRLQKKHLPAGRKAINGIQTNGTLINREWCGFFITKGFIAGISIDGPPGLHNICRITETGKPTSDKVIRGYELLRKYNIPCEILCVVNSFNVRHPLDLYNYFKKLGASFITFLPLVNREPGSQTSVTGDSVDPEGFGTFLMRIFDEWVEKDIGRIKIQLFEEMIRPAFGQEHTLCIFREICGGVPVIEQNGDFYSCDHFVDDEHLVGNIMAGPLTGLLDSKQQQTFGRDKFISLPRYCRICEVRPMCNGECPKNRFIRTPDGESGLNYLCKGYKMFFKHCQPFVEAISEVWKNQKT